MVRGRPVFAGMVMVVAVGTCCLAAVACSSSPSDPLANVTGLKVATEAVDNLQAAPSLTMDGAGTESGQTVSVNLGIIPGKGCTGTIGEGSKGSVSVVEIGASLYLKLDNTMWQTIAGSEAAKVVQLVDGRYVKESASSSTSGASSSCNISQVFGPNMLSATFTKDQVTTLDGIRVLPLKDSDGGTMYVSDTSKPELVEISVPKGTASTTGQFTINVGAPVTLTAPPASQVINASDLGL